MEIIILFFRALGLVLVGGAIHHVRHLARIAPRPRLRVAWTAMAGALLVTLVLGAYTTVDRYMEIAFSSVVLIESLVNLSGAVFIFAVALLSRLTAEDVLLNAELEVAAFTDALTGLPNRRRFDMQLPDRMELARRRKQALTMVMLDIDHFKRVNDRYGHEWGDEVLRHIGRLLDVHKREEDMAFRIGGEEFVVVAPHTPLEQGGALAERLRFTIEHTVMEKKGLRIPITVSLGVAQLRPEDDLATLLARADAALYRAKELGRNRGCLELPRLTVVEATGPRPVSS
ncbi:GGDEF domain-containing protein [Ancylobacter sp. A5.8]|uniref:GGDEF domain-containing protein n=1 Tax=Ancylobacter gelatini TaxID=2919920 RepID=UPI001F4E5A56|nr:GGDEF domain-containing protein [Ancylobacter gelatini]MCJ8144140.1 GGDEF domain-containing protein [Ancylobacter gelatini]